MRRTACLLLCLGLCCALSGCGKPAPIEPTATTITTTKAPTTTEEITTVFVPLSGEKNGVSWRTVDLDDKENTATKKWLEEWYVARGPGMREYKTEWPMGKEKTIVYKEGPYPERQLALRNNATGKRLFFWKAITLMKAIVKPDTVGHGFAKP